MDQPGAFALDINLDCPCCYRPGEPFVAEAPGMAKITASHKLSALRVLMAEHDIDAYLVFSEDAHNSEYVSASDERRGYLTGFTGSAGVALVTSKKAQLWTDSRYFIQAAEQLSPEWELMKMYEPNVPSVEEELYNSCAGKKVGLDPSTMPQSKATFWQEIWNNKADGDKVPTLNPITTNLVDEIWNPSIRPAIPQNPIAVHPVEIAGEEVTSKLQRVRDAIQKEGNAGGLVISALDQTAWLYNLRGSDIDCNPVFFSYSIVSQTSARLFLGRKNDGMDWLDEKVRKHLDESGVEVYPYIEFGKEAIESMFPEGGRIMVEKGSCSMAVAEAVSKSAGCTMVETESVSPVEAFKARKNDAEIQGIKESAIRDSVALVEFAAWLTEQMNMEEGTRDDMHEAALAETLLGFRKKQPGFIQNSFDTISSVGANSAVIHYKPMAGSDKEKVLTPADIYLLDSGGQYLLGTTDVTRTFHFGEPTDEQRRMYTRVLQGHINLATAVFPSKTPGLVLDTFARSPLWQDGLVYGHGTGHGIGAYMNVHEGPMGIGGGNQPGDVIRKNPRMQAYYLEPIVSGMYLSNEPGYYLEGKFGFRIESDMIAVPRDDNMKSEDGSSATEFLKFDTVTKVPMCRSLCDVSLMTPEQLEWLNAYHADCRAAIAPLLSDSKALAWLETETMPL